MKIAVVSFTDSGSAQNARIVRILQEKGHCVQGCCVAAYALKWHLQPLTISVGSWTKAAFTDNDALIFVGASGIAVRSIAPCVKDKFHDPAVLVIDEKGQYVIPILSGHVGGANALTMMLAQAMHAVPVITTATDIQHCFAVDVFAAKNQFVLTDRQKAKQISARLLQGEKQKIYFCEGCEPGDVHLPDGLMRLSVSEESHIAVDYHRMTADGTLQLIPKHFLWIGIGCRRGTTQAEIEDGLLAFLEKNDLCIEAVAGLASIDLKKDEAGLIDTASKYRWPFVTASAEELQAVRGLFTGSEFVREQTGVDNVCERSAVWAAGDGGRLISEKQVWPGITFAAARTDRRIYFE